MAFLQKKKHLKPKIAEHTLFKHGSLAIIDAANLRFKIVCFAERKKKQIMHSSEKLRFNLDFQKLDVRARKKFV